MTASFSPREFLRSRYAVLVHFSTVMSSHPELLFPADMHQAAKLRGVPLAFSTIQCGDGNPWSGGRGGAEGSIGMIVDIGADTIIHSVSPDDSGSSLMGSLGLPPTAESCAASVDQRTTSNEWHVQDYVPIGIFILPPVLVRQSLVVPGLDEPVIGDAEISLEQAIHPFPNARIFSTTENTFIEFDRALPGWRAITYDDILPS